MNSSDVKSIAIYLQSLDKATILLLPTLIGLIIAKKFNPVELEVIVNFLTNIADAITTILVLIEVQEENDNVQNAKQVEQVGEIQSIIEGQEKLERQFGQLQKQNQTMQKHLEELGCRLK